jgi:beta-glucanase (GH16 family)
VVTPPDPNTIIKMPVGDLPGWKQVFTDDFVANAPAGTFARVYGKRWAAYDGFPDTDKGGTYSKDILSVKNGVLDMYLHNQNGRPQVAAPSPIVTIPWAGQTYGKFTVRFKSEALTGLKTAWLLWPSSGNWDDGEINFPEGPLTGEMKGFNHCVGNPSENCSSVNTQTPFTDWHTTSIEWTPERVTFMLDGRTVANDTANIPRTPMFWVLQTETTSRRPDTQDGHLKIAWVSVYTYTNS